jgi:hypothetical protein
MPFIEICSFWALNESSADIIACPAGVVASKTHRAGTVAQAGAAVLVPERLKKTFPFTMMRFEIEPLLVDDASAGPPEVSTKAEVTPNKQRNRNGFMGTIRGER